VCACVRVRCAVRSCISRVICTPKQWWRKITIYQLKKFIICILLCVSVSSICLQWCCIFHAYVPITWIQIIAPLCFAVLMLFTRVENTGWGISRLTPLYPKPGSNMAALNMATVAPMSRISCSFTTPSPPQLLYTASQVRTTSRSWDKGVLTHSHTNFLAN
jgi:hypothetical protein